MTKRIVYSEHDLGFLELKTFQYCIYNSVSRPILGNRRMNYLGNEAGIMVLKQDFLIEI